jgi:hypothetical protein
VTSAPYSNPFRYGDVATGSFFTNRERELSALHDDVVAGQNVVIISPRRFGKTSLIVEAARRLRAERVLVAYVDLFRAPTKERFIDLVASAVYEGLVNPLERLRQNALELFQKLPIQPRVSIGPDGTPSFEFSLGQRTRDIDRTLEELLALPGKIALERQRRVAVVFDEFQQVLEIDRHLPGLMRAVFQMQSEVAHIFLGSQRHLMNDVFNERNQPLYKMAKPLTLRPISRDDFAPFIAARFQETGLHISAEAVEAILDTTGGHPHDTQELCYFTWALARPRNVAAIGASEIEEALGQLLDAESAHFTTLWESLSAHQRVLLVALTHEPGPIYSEAFRGRHRLGSAASVQRSVARLVAREIVEQETGNGYRVSDVFFRSWIARRI